MEPMGRKEFIDTLLSWSPFAAFVLVARMVFPSLNS